MDAVIQPSAPDAKTMLVTKVGALPMSLVALLPLFGWYMGGGLWHWFTVLFAFIILPVTDQIVGDQPYNVAPEDETRVASNIWYRVSLWMYLPIQVGVMLFCYDLVAGTGYFVALAGPLQTYEIIGLAISNAFAVGIGGTLSHELCHRESRFDQFVGVLVFGVLGMANFIVYHNYGHHRVVATPQDPATARYGESFWTFTWRNTFGKFFMSWRLERDRMRRLGLPIVHPRNLMLWCTAFEVSFFAMLVYLFGAVVALPMFLLQYIAIRGFLSVGDYLEHYGLNRQRMANGEYERPRPIHAWDDSYVVSSMATCVVNRHSDHHANEARPMQVLRHMKEAPRYPHGNLTMIYAAMIPPLWRKIVHPVVERFYAQTDVVPYGNADAMPEKFRDRAVLV